MAEPPRVLMIDNNLGDQQLVRIAFDEARIPVDLIQAMDGKEGQEALRRTADGAEPPPRVVLLDLNMPRMDGREVLIWARSQPALSELRIVVLTSSHVPRDREDCLALGATDFVVKPTDFDAYLALVEGLRPYLGS
jgi:CheY-like chemotaxis protein